MPDKLELTPSSPLPPPVSQDQMQSLSTSLPIFQVMNVPRDTGLPRSFSQPDFSATAFLQPQHRLLSLSPSFAAQHPLHYQERDIAPLAQLQTPESVPSGSWEPLDRAISGLEIDDQAAGNRAGMMQKPDSAQDIAEQAMRLPELICCGDVRARSKDLRSLHEGFHSQKINASGNNGDEGIKEFLDDVIEFPEMITESDLMLKIADKGAVVALLAANHQHPGTGVPTIELFISRADQTDSVHLLRAAIGQLRQTPDSPVWIKRESTHLSEAQLRGYGFKNAPDENYMVLRETLRVQRPAQRKMAGSRALSSAPRELSRALSLVNRYLITEKQPDINIYRLDVNLLPQVIDSLNRQKPGLNLAYLKNIGEVTHAFTNISAGSCQRFILRSCMAEDTAGTLHHLVLDTFRDEQNRLSIIIMDSVTVDAQELGHRDLTRYLSDAHSEACICFIGTGVQRSPYDCIPYSLDMASKSYQQQPLMQGIHQSMLERNQVSGRSGRVYLPDDQIVLVHPHFAGDILSAEFFKHMSSTTLMMDMLSRYPELNETAVNKKGEHVRERQRRLVATHSANMSGEEKKITYNTSIEHKRLKTIDKL